MFVSRFIWFGKDARGADAEHDKKQGADAEQDEEQLKREQLESCIEDLQQQLSMEKLKRQQLETYIAELLSRSGKLPFVNELPATATFFEEVFQK